MAAHSPPGERAMHGDPGCTKRRGIFRIDLRLAFVFAIWLTPAWPQNPAPAQPQTSQAALEYVGSEICQGCNEDISKAFKKSPNELLETAPARKGATKAGESCHGPASKHIESVSAADIRQPAKLRPAETD